MAEDGSNRAVMECSGKYRMLESMHSWTVPFRILRHLRTIHLYYSGHWEMNPMQAMY